MHPLEICIRQENAWKLEAHGLSIADPWAAAVTLPTGELYAQSSMSKPGLFADSLVSLMVALFSGQCGIPFTVFCQVWDPPVDRRDGACS